MKYTYTIYTYYKGDGPYEQWSQSFCNPVHKGEQVEVYVEGWDDGIEFDVFCVSHRNKDTILFCEYADICCPSSFLDLRAALVKKTEAWAASRKLETP